MKAWNNLLKYLDLSQYSMKNQENYTLNHSTDAEQSYAWNYNTFQRESWMLNNFAYHLGEQMRKGK